MEQNGTERNELAQWGRSGEELDIRCRFGDHAPAVGIYWVPKGCICWPDPVQALCMQHFLTAESTGDIIRIVDLEAPKPSYWPAHWASGKDLYD
jgi:hypothetical protein